MKIFVTGGAGFVGSHMVDALLEDQTNDVTIYDNFSTGQAGHLEHVRNNPELKIVQGDLLDVPALNKSICGHDLVFHFAANSDISKGADNPGIDFRQTVVATFNLLEAMRLGGVSRIAFASGSGVYGDQGTFDTSETFGPLLPISMYGAGKLAAEAMISSHAHMFDITAYVFRFANVVGARQTHGVAYDFIRKLKENPSKLQILGDGLQSKSYIHVSDVVSAIMFVVENGKSRVNLFNIATGDYVTVHWIAEQVVKAMGLKDVDFDFAAGSRGWKGDIPIVRFNLDKIYGLGWKAKADSRRAIQQSVAEMLREL